MAPPIVRNKARIASYVLGALGLALACAATVLLIVVRDVTNVATTVTAGQVTTSVGPSPPKPLLKINNVTAANDAAPYDIAAFQGIVKPAVSTGAFNPSVSVTGTNPPPGQVPFNQTNTDPLVTAPQGFGWPVITPNADQFFVSLPNGYARVGQFQYVAGEDQYTVFRDAYTSNLDEVLFQCAKDSTGVPAIDIGASAVGSLGYAASAVSLDGVRLYVGYHAPFMGQSAKSSLYPFTQLAGSIAVFTRPINVNGPPNSKVWTFDCTLQLRGPYGGQTAGVDTPTNPYTQKLLPGDQFGQVIRTTLNLVNGRRIVAARANYGEARNAGALVAIYEEDDENKHVVSGILTLTDNLDGSTTFTSEEKLMFGWSFDVGDDALVASVPFGGATPRLVYFRRDLTTNLWTFKQFIAAPDAQELFGTSVCLNPNGDLMVVGAPQANVGNSSGVGGHVYLYKRSADGNSWTLEDQYTETGATRAFGMFVSKDPDLRMIAVSGNQNNGLGTLTLPTVNPAKSELPTLVFIPIDQVNAKFGTNNLPTPISQPAFQLTQDYIDPTFGAHAAMAFLDTSTLKVLAPIPANGKTQLYDVSVS